MVLLFAGWAVADVLRIFDLNGAALMANWSVGVFLVVLISLLAVFVVQSWRRIGRHIEHGNHRTMAVLAKFVEGGNQ